MARQCGKEQSINSTGQLLSSWELARHYGFTDYDGRRPDWGALTINWSAMPPAFVELFRTATRQQIDLAYHPSASNGAIHGKASDGQLMYNGLIESNEVVCRRRRVRLRAAKGREAT